MEVYANSMVVIILQYISISNQHAVYLKLTQKLYADYISINLGEKKGRGMVSHQLVDERNTVSVTH